MTAIFTYTLPSGAVFRVDAPDNTTQRQVDEVFYSQVAAGSLVGYTAGQTLGSPETIVTKFDLSRLDRGTAGVDQAAILAIIAGLPSAAQIPTLEGIPLDNPISQANVIAANSGLGASSIGPLTGPQVQSLLAQNAAQVDQPAEVATIELGVGKYGLTSLQLEEAGYLKPGTTARFLNPNQVPGAPNPPNFLAVLNSPAVWATPIDLTDILANPQLQDNIQQALMRSAYRKLTNAGIIQTPSTAGVTLETGVVYGAAGLTSVNLIGLTDAQELQLAAASGGDTVALSAAQVLANSTAPTDPIGAAFSGLQQGQAYIQQAQALLTQTQQNIGALTQVAGKYGTQAAEAWSKGLPGLQDAAGRVIRGQIAGVRNQALGIVNTARGQALAIVNQGKAAIDSAGKMGKYAVDFANGKIDSLTTGVKKAAQFSDTVNRSTVNEAVRGILGNPKIPNPDFSSASALAASTNRDIEFAKNALNSLNSGVGQVLAQGQAIAGTVRGVVNTAQTIGGSIGGIGAGVAGQARNFGTGIAGEIGRGIRLG